MNWADWTIIAILAVSSLIGLTRGLVKEALSLLCWAAAFVVALTFKDPLAKLLVDAIATPSIREMAAFGALFVATLIVGAMVNYLIGELVKMTGLSGTDRLLGTIFGLIRGAVVVMALVILLPAIVPVNEDAWWRQSILIPHFLEMESWARDTASAFYNQILKLLN